MKVVRKILTTNWDKIISLENGVKYNKQQLLICLLFPAENSCLEETKAGIVYRLMDFGTARRLDDELKFEGMTPEYLSPEIAKLALQRHGSVSLYPYIQSHIL